MDKETIIKGCENWVNTHKGENYLLTYSSVVELLTLLKKQEERIKELELEKGWDEYPDMMGKVVNRMNKENVIAGLITLKDNMPKIISWQYDDLLQNTVGTLECAIELLEEQKEKMEHLNNITLEYEKEVFRLQTLLKAQDAVEPINSYGTFRCGNCEHIVGYDDGHWHGYRNNFCSECGKAVKWE